MITTISSIEFNILKNSSLGERIRFLRTKLMDEVDPVLYTTNAISNRTGIAAQTLTSIERGESKKPSFKVIHLLAKEFNVPMDVFTDEYYEGEEMLFSIGKPSTKERELKDDIDLNDDYIELEEGDSILFKGAEYVVGKASVPSRRRNICIYVVEELYDGRDKALYEHEVSLKEDSLLQMLSQIIQAAELNVMNLSSSEWTKAIEKSPLKEANKIVSQNINDFNTIRISTDFYDSVKHL